MAAYGNGNRHQYSCLENPMDRAAWQVIAHGAQRVGHDKWATNTYDYRIAVPWWCYTRLPGESNNEAAEICQETLKDDQEYRELTNWPDYQELQELTRWQSIWFTVSSTLHYFSGTWEAQPLCHPSTVYRTSTGKRGCWARNIKGGMR